MTVSIGAAIGAYQQVAGQAATGGMNARPAVPGQSFQEILGDMNAAVRQTGTTADTLSLQAMTGKADVNEVVMAVANADMALQTVVAVRDRVVQAYQEILRMPI